MESPRRHRRAILLAAACVLVAVVSGCGRSPTDASRDVRRTDDPNAPFVLRVGHFPNLTHMQALIARNMARDGPGWFEPRLGANVRLEWYTYNAGPSAMEAIFAQSLDMSYVGPNPALNAYIRSRGSEIRVVAGALLGGSGLVVQPNSGLRKPADFRGKRIASPQLGNTQDIAARAWLAAGGLKITQLGGDAFVIPTANSDQIALFKQKQLDAVWGVEPWLSRLELGAGADLVVDDREAVTTVLVSSVAMLRDHRHVVQRFVAAHRELTAWIEANPAEAQRRVVAELTELTRGGISANVVAHAWPRMQPTANIELAPFAAFQDSALESGLQRQAADLAKFVEAP
jgi:NitT/TauT family transport system substrate-binding protein